MEQDNESRLTEKKLYLKLNYFSEQLQDILFKFAERITSNW